ncbi:MAG TPA: hypothetical protein VNV63_07225, partial [Nitrospiria bacterium]|nr:hypothetical protein [Nitrospiria bacterium]
MNEYRAMRMMNMADRMNPQARSHFSGGRGGLGQNPMLSSMLSGEAQQPDYSSFTYDPAARQAAQQYLGQFGLSPVAPQNVQHNAFLPNTGFFGNHPRLSGMLEGGLFGAAATRGSDTWGEGISNVAGGMLEAKMARQGMINQQFAKPFQAAHMLEGMRDMTQKRELQSMEIEHMRVENQKLGRPDHDMRSIPMTRNDVGVYNYDNTDGKGQFVKNPDYDPKGNPIPHDPWDDYKNAHPEQSVDEQLKGYHKLIQAPEREAPVHVPFFSSDGTLRDLRPGQKMPAGSVKVADWEKLNPQQKERITQIHNQLKVLNSPQTLKQRSMQRMFDPAWQQAHPNAKPGEAGKSVAADIQSEINALNKEAQDISGSAGGNPMGGGQGTATYNQATGQ